MPRSFSIVWRASSGVKHKARKGANLQTVVVIGHRQQACPQRNLVRLQAIRKTQAIKPLMVVAHQLGYRSQFVQRHQGILSIQRVLSVDIQFLRTHGPYGAGQQRIGEPDLSNIVQQSPTLEMN